jgi:hypothetical protein
LGEVILNFAEAAADSGRLEEARMAANEIRARAGMPDLPQINRGRADFKNRNDDG